MSYFKSDVAVDVKPSVYAKIEAELKKISKSSYLRYRKTHFYDDANWSGNLIFDIEIGKLEKQNKEEDKWTECEHILPVAQKLNPLKFKLINIFIKKEGKDKVAYATFCRTPTQKERI